MSILDELEAERIFWVSPDQNGSTVWLLFKCLWEACDGHFDVELSKIELIELAKELLLIAKGLTATAAGEEVRLEFTPADKRREMRRARAISKQRGVANETG